MTFRETSREMSSGVAWVAVAAALNQAATLLAAILVANVVGEQRFGTYSFLQSTLTSWAQAAALSSGLVASRYLAAYGQKDAKLAGDVIGYCTAMTAVAGGLAGVLLLISRPSLIRSIGDASSLGSGLLIIAFFLPFMCMTFFQTGALIGLERYRAQAKLSIFQAIAFVGGPFIGAQIDGAIGAIAGLATAIMIRFISQRIALIHTSRKLGIRPNYRNIGAMSRLFFRFALPASLTGLAAGASLWLSTLILLKQEHGLQQMGYFGAGQYFRLLVLFIPIQLTTVGVPLLTRHLAIGAHAKYASVLHTGFILTAASALTVASALAIIATPLLHIFGTGFIAATALARVMLMGAVIEAIAGAVYQVLPSRELMWRSLVMVALPREFTFLIACWLLIPKYLSLGLGYALMAGQCVGFFGVIIARRIPENRQSPTQNTRGDH